MEDVHWIVLFLFRLDVRTQARGEVRSEFLSPILFVPYWQITELAASNFDGSFNDTVDECNLGCTSRMLDRWR